MGAQDKLVPAAGVIANNLYGTKFNTKSTFRITPKSKSLYANPEIDALNFLGSIHAKQLRIADNNAIWNGTLANNPPLALSDQVLSQYALDKGIHDEVLPGFAATTIEEWNELQTGISRAYNIVNFYGLNTVNGYSINEAIDSITQAGIDLFNKFLFDAFGNQIGNPLGYTPGPLYADAWNSIKVPYDKVTWGVDSPYIAPVYPTSVAPLSAWYRYTGKSRWAFPFTGWDLTK